MNEIIILDLYYYGIVFVKNMKITQFVLIVFKILITQIDMKQKNILSNRIISV